MSEEGRKERKISYVCCEFNSNSNPKNDKNLRFHSFPKEGNSQIYSENSFGNSSVILPKKLIHF